ILASRRAHRQRLWRPQPLLLLPTGRRIRERVAHASRVLVSPSRRDNLYRAKLGHEEMRKEKFVIARTRSPARGTARYPSGASSGAATTRVWTRRSALPFVSSAAAEPASWHSASLLTL